jgi:hypothetical protein
MLYKIRRADMRLASNYGLAIKNSSLWLGWPYLTKKIQSKKPRPSRAPSQSVLAAGKMSS